MAGLETTVLNVEAQAPRQPRPSILALHGGLHHRYLRQAA